MFFFARWSEDGSEIEVNLKLFATSPTVQKYFSCKWSSFGISFTNSTFWIMLTQSCLCCPVRQLNLYGFKKILPEVPTGTDREEHSHTITCICFNSSTFARYCHTLFRRDNPTCLAFLTRQIKSKSATTPADLENLDDSACFMVHGFFQKENSWFFLSIAFLLCL